MPNIIAHYVCGKLVAKKLNINSEEYIKGNIFPDYIDKRKHYRVQGKMFEVPDLERFKKEEDIKNSLFKLGFLTHLMLDKLFLDEYVINNIYSKIDKKINVFEPDKIYLDYTNISSQLLKYYDLSLDDIDDLISKSISDIDVSKYKRDTESIKFGSNEKLKYLDFDEFNSFIKESSEKIAEYLK